jgi:hypothetical protein
MTFYELYQQYLKKYTAPRQGIMSIQPVTPVGTSVEESGGADSPSPGMTPGPTGATEFSNPFENLSALDVALGLMNPVGFAVSKVAEAVGLPSLSEIGKSAMNAFGFAGPQAGDLGYTDYSDADIGPMGPQAGDLGYTDYSDADIGPMGPQAGDNTGNTNTNTGNTGFGDDNDGYGNDGDSSGVDSAGDGGDGYATGGRVGLYDRGSAFDNYNAPEYIPSEDKNLSDYFNANVNYSTGESNPMNDVNVGTTNLQAIMNANIPIDDQFSLLGRLGYFKDRASVTYKDYPEEIYEGSSKDRALGLGYYNNGLSASGMYNVDTKSPELRLDYTTKFANGGRIGYAEGSITQEGVIPGFTKLKNPDGAPGNYNEFMYEGPDGQIYGAGTYSSIAAGMYPNIYEPSTLKSYSNIPELTQLMSDVNQKAGTTVIRNLEEADAYLKANAQTAPTVAEQIISTNNLSPFSSAPLTSVAEKLFPQGNFLNIKETATSPTEYNIEATKDLVENLPGGIVKDIVAPTAAFALSLPYDAIQAYQRMEPGSGIQGFGKAFQAERPLESAFERFTGAAGPLAENINTAISSLNPFQKQQYMNYAVQNPEQAIAAAQQNKDFLEATRKNIAPTVSSPFLNAPKTPIGLFPGGGGGQTTPLIDEGPKTPIGLFPNRGGGEIKPLMADGGRVFYLQGGLASLLG